MDADLENTTIETGESPIEWLAKEVGRVFKTGQVRDARHRTLLHPVDVEKGGIGISVDGHCQMGDGGAIGSDGCSGEGLALSSTTRHGKARLLLGVRGEVHPVT